MSLRIAEVFGPTAQGEGPHIGHVCAFVRLSGCNLSCSWCDTPYTWDWTRYDRDKESVSVDAAEVGAIVGGMAVERVVITGGEPMIQQQRIPELFGELPSWLPIDVETNGTIPPTPAMVDGIATFVVSPKITPSALQSLTLAHRVGALGEFRELAKDGKAAFKYVARNSADVAAIRYHVGVNDLAPVYVMPEGRTRDDVIASTRRIADEVVGHGWRLTTRLHVLAWGDERGR